MKTKRFGLSLGRCGPIFCQILFATLVLATVSVAQSIPGTLSSALTTRTISLGGGCTETIRSSTWSFLDPQGASHAFPGSSAVVLFSGGSPNSCPHTVNADALSTWSTDGLFYLKGTVSGTTITEVVSLASGYINPKYLIVGVTYAPPGGTNSFVSYASTNFVGMTSSNMSSFAQNYTESVSISGGAGCGGGVGNLVGFSATACVTGTESTGDTQTSNTSNSITLSMQTTTSDKTPGVPNVYSPVDHDYDIIYLWLNPVVLFNVPGTNTPTSGTVTWTGYGYDYADPLHEVDIWPVYVGWLNGHFANGQTITCNGVVGTIDCQDADAFARGWVTTQMFAPGAGPGITSSDYPKILSADPFAANPAYTVTLDPGQTPPTTTDGRFSVAEQSNTTPESFPYKQAPLDSPTGLNEMFAQQYSNSSTVGKGATSTFTQGFGLEEKFNDTFFGLGVQYDFKQNWNYTWTNSWQNTVTNTTTQVNTLSITGPPCPATVAPCNPQYTEPHEFATYQDNLYGTFMFWPNPYFSINSVTPQSQTVLAGGRASYTVTTGANAGYTGTLTSFSVTGLPSGGSFSFSPTTGAAGVTTILTVATTSATPAGTYPLMISATDGSLTYFGSATLVVSAAPGFTISVTPASETIGIGGGTTFTTTLASKNGFTSNVSLTVDGLPSGSSATFSPTTVTGSGSSTLSLTSTAAIAPGSYTLTFIGTSGSLTSNTTAMLVVTGANFMLSAAPEIQAINAGSNAVFSVSTSVVSGFDGSIVFNVTGLPSGCSATFNPTAVTGVGSSNLTITTSTSTPAGDYNLTVTGTSGSVVQSTMITLEVNN